MQRNIEQDNDIPDVISASKLIASGYRTSSTLVSSCLTKINIYNPKLKAFGEVFADDALEEAENCDREALSGKLRGPLHGVPFGVKDLFSTKGLRTTKGSLTSLNNIPDQDAPIVARLKAAGAILIGMNRHG